MKKRYAKILYICSRMAVVTAFFMLLPLFIALVYGEWGHLASFVIPAIGIIGMSIVIGLATKRYRSVEIDKKTGIIIVVMSWVVCILLSTIPFMLEGYSFTDSVYECTSAWTATGYSILPIKGELYDAANSLIMWRSVMHFVGGIGLVLVMLSVVHSKQTAMLYNIEGHASNSFGNVKQNIRIVFVVYIGIIVVGSIAFCILGMSLFDSANFAMSAAATGGMSPVPDGLAHSGYNTIGVEIVAALIMLLSSCNFIIYCLIISGRARSVIKISEFKAMPIVVGLGTLAILLASVTIGDGISVGGRVWEAFFVAVNAMSTTGFGSKSGSIMYLTQDVASVLNGGIIIAMVVLVFIGGSSGSTTGGIKQYRFMILIKNIWWRMKRVFVPSSVIYEDSVNDACGKIYCDASELSIVYAVISMFALATLVGGYIIVLDGHSLADSMLVSIASVTNSGIFATLQPIATFGVGARWTLILLMFCGRLEFYILIVALTTIGRSILIKGERDNQ